VVAAIAAAVVPPPEPPLSRLRSKLLHSRRSRRLPLTMKVLKLALPALPSRSPGLSLKRLPNLPALPCAVATAIPAFPHGSASWKCSFAAS
jgi:hypothetical protein